MTYGRSVLRQLCLQDVVPAFPICRSFDEGSGFRRVARAQLLVIPLDFLSCAVSDVPEVIGFGCPTRVLEVRPGHRTVPLGIVDPLYPVSRRARQRLGRLLEILEFLLG